MMLKFTEYMNEAKFSGTDITKRDGEYVDLVIQRIKDQKPFLFSDGNRELIVYDDNVKNLESSNDPSSLLKKGSKFIGVFNVASGKSYRWNDIEKSIFTGSIDRLKKEKIVTGKLNEQILQAVDEFGGPITVMISKFKIENVMYASSEHIKGTPKADITLMTPDKKEVGFISHKADSGAKAFQQYGGITSKSDKEINESPLVKFFAKRMYEHLNEKYGKPEAQVRDSFHMMIPKNREGTRLVATSVYGKKWNKGKTFSRESVHCIGQGDPILAPTSTPGIYSLTFSSATHYANDISWAFNGEYRAIFASRYTSDRGLSSGGIRVRKIRAGIFPIGYIRGRRTVDLS